MRLDASDDRVEAPVLAMERVIKDHGGYVAPDLVVRERAGEFSCAIAERFGEPGRILIDYPSSLRPDLTQVVWAPDESRLIPLNWASGMPTEHRILIEAWVDMINTTGKLREVASRLPVLAISDPELRQSLASMGYPRMHQQASVEMLHQQMFAWHSAPQPGPEGGTGWRLLPLKCFVNNDPDGAPQRTMPGRTRVVTSRSSDGWETFEDYGDLDALQLLMSFGYVDQRARVVHSLPVRVVSSRLGSVEVGARSPRQGLVDVHPLREKVPDISVGSDLITLSRLSFRPGSRGAVRQILAMLITSRIGLPEHAAATEADHLLDDILQANERVYAELEQSLRQQPGSVVVEMLGEVCAVQTARLRVFWP